MKKLNIFSLFVLISAVAIWGANSNEIKAIALDEDVYEEGVLPIDEIDIEEYVEHYKMESAPINFDSRFLLAGSSELIDKDSCDLSDSIYFPSIGKQKGGSCVSWATTYYQFTYEANKLNNINIKENNDLAYSPVWTFNFLNQGVNSGSTLYKAYDFLKEHGALKIADCGYDAPLYSWSTKTDKMIEALNTRIARDGVIRVNANNASENLDEIKSVLYGTNGTDGKALTFSTYNRWVVAVGKNLETGEEINVSYRCYQGGAHSMTIVGYDDNVWVDINGNEKVEDCEKGAFKVANSWGVDSTSESNNEGFLWIAYDALNATSSVSGNWEEELIKDKKIELDNKNYSEENKNKLLNEFQNREPAFYWYESGYNTVYWIEVENKSPMYIGQLEIDTNLRNSLEFYAKRNETVSKNKKLKVYNQTVTVNNESKIARTLPISYQGTLVFDYDDLCSPISSYTDGYNWGIEATGNHESLNFFITDSLSNRITEPVTIEKNGNSYSTSQSISLSMGDLNYDGVVDVADSKILFESMYADKPLSNLQKYLATDMETDFQIHAAVTSSGYDDIGEVLDSVNAGNIFWNTVPDDVSLQTLIDGDYDVLFINCANQINIDEDVVKGFVEQGGTVYASDWALDVLIDAFPERGFTFTELPEQTVSANIIDNGLLKSTGFENSTISINFDLPDWRLITSSLQDDVTVYINGTVNNDTYPLVFSFPYGNNGGKVYYTSFHQDANLTSEMQEVLNDLTLTISHSKDSKSFSDYAIENNYTLTLTTTGLLNTGAVSNSYPLEVEDGNDFIVITDETGNFSLELTAPDGTTYSNYENGDFVAGLISPSSATPYMRVYRLGKRGIKVINPINATSDSGWNFKVISHTQYRSSFAVGIAEKTTSDYLVDYAVTSDWGAGRNITVTITNIGDTPIRNWALRCEDFGGTIINSSVWNAKLQGENILKCQMYNSDIGVGASVTLGYTLNDATGEIPEFALCSFRNAMNDGYAVDFDVLNDWGSGFVGQITITNTTDNPIMAWELSFIAENFSIPSPDQFEIVTQSGNNYTITGTYNGNIPIPANSSITLQFNGEKNGTPTISNISMSEMINE